MNQTILPLAGVSLGGRFGGRKSIVYTPLTRHRGFSLTLVFVGFLSVLATGIAQAADVTLTLSNTGSQTSFGTALNWSDSLAPSGGNNYFVADGFTLRSTVNASGGNVEFEGDQLTLGDGTTLGNLALIATGGTVTVGDLVLDNGRISKGGNTDSSGTFSGNVTLAGGGGTFFSNETRHLTVNAPVSGMGQLRLDTAAAADQVSTITINSANTYTGGTIWTNASAGDTVNLGSTTALGAAAGSLNLNNAVGLLNLGGNNIGVGKLDGLAGSVIHGGTTAGTSTLTVGNEGTGNDGSPSSFAGVLQDGTGGRVLALTKTGSGTQTLAGDNTYTGATVVNGGTLLVNGSQTGGGAYTVGVSGTLGGTGSTTSALSIAGTLAPGASIGSLSSGTLDLLSTSIFEYEVDSAASAGFRGDRQLVNGDLNITSGAELTLDDLSGPFAFTEGTTFTLINYSGTWDSGLFTFDGDEIGNDGTFVAGLTTWQLTYDASSGGENNFGGSFPYTGFVNIVAVPEPGTFVMIACGGAVALAALRRRMRA